VRSERKAEILVVDDHLEMVRLLADQLLDAGYRVAIASSGAEALGQLKQKLPDVVITDLRMQGLDGLDLLDAVRALDPGIPVLLMTAFGAIETAVEAIRRGAYHYLTKPFKLEEVLIYVERALEDRKLRDENRALRREVGQVAKLETMVGKSAAMLALFDLIERVAQSDAPVLIRGESGTGKELVARALHALGQRRNEPIVAVNCTALTGTLLESELFGHVRGAFTGASAPRRGLFVEADGGTLFLDEIGDMAPDLQAKLLRVLEDGEVRAVGADVSRKVDVRIIAATHQPMEERLQEGKFRADLFYRLNVVPLSVPPLRDRSDDLPLLIDHFLARAKENHPTTRVQGFSPELVSLLSKHNWPGNVRELENLVKRLVIVSTGEVIGVEDYERHVELAPPDAAPLARWKNQLVTLRQLEDEYIAWVIQKCEGNKTRAAEILGIDVSTIHRREKSGGR
jgi:two-component system, NtrC family, response regulator HydG